MGKDEAHYSINCAVVDGSIFHSKLSIVGMIDSERERPP